MGMKRFTIAVVVLVSVMMVAGGILQAQNHVASLTLRNPGVASPISDVQLPAKQMTQNRVQSISPRPATIASAASVSLAGGNRLVSIQNTDGGWGWPLSGSSATNIIGPVAMGLAQAYQQTGNSSQGTALTNAGAYLLAKVNNFSPPDGYLAAQLDKIFGGTTYVTFVKTNFYDQLAAGTYNRNGSGTLYTTASYVNLIRTARAGQGTPNLAAWDIGTGLVGAAMCGASTTDWIAGVKAEINELDGNDVYDVLGLAASVYGLAFVHEDFDPTAGQHAAASNINDLADILLSYQISGGGFTWNSGYVTSGNETNQETGYAILALNEVNRSTYLTAIQGAATYLMGVQLGTGGWDNFVGDPDGESNETTGEALWGIMAAYPPPVYNVTKGVYYPTIQGAITDAGAGNVIDVAAGTYDERIIINKSLTLKGATNGVSKKGFSVPPAYAYDPLTQSIIKPSAALEQAMVQITADNVVFDGFVVANEVCQTGGVYQDLIGIAQGFNAPTGIQILNNVLGPNTNTASQDGTKGRCGVTVYGPHPNVCKLIVKYNKIFDSKGNGGGIMIVGPYGPTYHGGTTYASMFSGSVIDNNEIIGNHRSGIELAGGVQGGSAPADYFMITNNIIANNGWYAVGDKDNLKYGQGICFIRGGSDKTLADANPSRYITIENNEIKNNEKSGYYMGPINEDIFSNNNIIKDNGLGTGGYSQWDGVRIDLAESYYPPGTYINYGFLTNVPFANNTITGNGSMGFRVIQTPTLGPVIAENNWWGKTAQVDVQAMITGSVDFDPWIGKATGITVLSDSVNYTYNVTNTDVDIKFTSLPSGTNTTVTVQQTPEIPTGIPAPPPSAGTVAPLYLQIDGGGLVNGTFSATITIDVSGIAGFSSTTEVMYYSVASSSWVGVNGTYAAGPPATYTFTTDHFTPFAFVNPTNPVNLYLTMDNTDVNKNIFYPHAILGTVYGADDWSYSPMKDTIYVVPVGTQGIVAANFKILYDATMATASAAAGDLFAGGLFNTSTPAPGQLLIQTANLSPGINVVPGSNKYLARIIFTISKPGYNSISLDDLDFRYFVSGPDTQASVYVTGNPGAIKFYLGDFANASNTTAGDGLINFNDLSPFSLAYWGQSGGTPPGYKSKFDVGPTNSSGAYFAMPTPDGKVEFEDLVIFAIGYGKSGAGQLPKQPAKPVTLALGTVQTAGGETRVPIVVSGTVSDVRALSMTLTYSSSGLTFKGVEKAGEMNNNYSFMVSKAENGKLMIDGAVLGMEHNGLSKAGVIAYAVFTGKGSVGIESAKARSSANSPIELKYGTETVQSEAIPATYALSQNYPNPFNPTTTIHYELAKEGHVEIVIYNMLGEVITTLVNGDQNAGYYDVTWNGQNDKRQTVASGVYLYKMRAGDFVGVQKMVLMK
jgi:hypothetical protein